jgi:hypothetical protein
LIPCLSDLVLILDYPERVLITIDRDGHIVVIKNKIYAADLQDILNLTKGKCNFCIAFKMRRCLLDHIAAFEDTDSNILS